MVLDDDGNLEDAIITTEIYDKEGEGRTLKERSITEIVDRARVKSRRWVYRADGTTVSATKKPTSQPWS